MGFHRIRMLFCVYFPFIIANIVIIFIMLTYYKDYLLLFVPDYFHFKFLLYKNSFQYSRFYLKKIFPHACGIIGFVVLILFTLCQLLLFTSLYRVFFSNPGYLPSPLELEWKKIEDDIASHRKLSKKDTAISITCLSNYENEENIKKSTSIGSVKINVYDKLDQLSQCGPLTLTEYTMIRREFAQSLRFERGDKYEKNQTDNKLGYDNQYQLSKNQICQVPREIAQMPLCGKCLRFKPERTHHCRQCNKCVLKMDHHCPWISNCIGLFNYKYFLLALFYIFASSTFVLLTFWESLLIMFLSPKITLNHCVWSTFAYICNFILWLFSGYLTMSNIKLVSINKTTIELADEVRFNNLQYNSNGKYYEDNSAIIEYSKYNKGTLGNLKEVFGNCILLWGVPFFGPKYDRYY